MLGVERLKYDRGTGAEVLLQNIYGRRKLEENRDRLLEKTLKEQGARR